MNVDLIEVNKPRARTAEELKLEAILRGLNLLTVVRCCACA